jgi:hypothetical protein
MCTPNTRYACTTGAADTFGVGACKAGVATCAADGLSLGACAGAVLPVAEVCSNLVDDDCDGIVNDGCTYTSCTALPAGAPTGAYRVDVDGAGALPAFNAWCDMTFSDSGAVGGWLDIVKTYRVSGNSASDLSSVFFASNTAATLTTHVRSLTNADFTPAVGIVNNINDVSGMHMEGFTLKTAYAFSRVRTFYLMQGCDNDYPRCTASYWIPLNGPGFNGGYGAYLSPCPVGLTCIQGSPAEGRDAPLAVFYATDSINSATTTLAWSGSGFSTCVINSCGREPSIPIATPSTWFTTLMLR